MTYNRLIKNFLREIILALMIDDEKRTPYEILGFIHKEFDTALSSGTLYSAVYSLERDGFLSGTRKRRGRSYQITEEGKEIFQEAQETYLKIKPTLDSMLLPKE